VAAAHRVGNGNVPDGSLFSFQGTMGIEALSIIYLPTIRLHTKTPFCPRNFLRIFLPNTPYRKKLNFSGIIFRFLTTKIFPSLISTFGKQKRRGFSNNSQYFHILFY
jgi:hypothetical protein